MKSPYSIAISFIAAIALLITTLFSVVGCAPKIDVTPPTPAPVSSISSVDLGLIQTGATVATGAVLNFGVTDSSSRTKLANQIYASAVALYKLTGGTVPTPSDFNSTLASYGITGVSQYTSYTIAIDTLYATYYAKYTTGNISSQNILAVVNALAAGAEAGASTYATISIVPVTTTMLKVHTDLRPPHGSICQASAYDLSYTGE